MPRLSEEAVAAYRRDGYTVIPNVFNADEVAEMRREVVRICAGAQGLAGNDAVFDLEDSHRPEAPRVRRIKLPHRISDVFGRLCRDERVLEPMRQLLGPSLRLHTTKLNLKSAGYGAPVEWHQDWAFYPHTNDDILAMGVMIDEMAPDNGALMVLPGSHTGPVYDHHSHGRFCGAMDPEACGLDFAKAVPLTGPAGSISLHHVRLVHGSAINTSGRDRRFALYEVTAADAWPIAGAYSPFTDLEEYDSRLLCGPGTTQPRLAPVPVRMPQPKPLDSSSIYQSQKGAARAFFAERAAPGEKVLAEAG